MSQSQGFLVSREISTKIDLYQELLRKWQAKINLVSPASLNNASVRHFSDSLQLANYIPLKAKLLYDLGSGAGFPGLVLAMARPDISVHLIEVDQRKASFLQTVSRETSTPVLVHISRVENTNLPPPDVITARALMSLAGLLELSEKWWSVSPECTLILPKGASFEEELLEARKSYDFSLAVYVSETDPAARILVLTQVCNRL